MRKNLTMLVMAIVFPLYLSAQQWQMVWSDEFNYSGLPDASKWNFENWAPGNVNNELQRYVPNRLENCRVENGSLIIEARRDWYNNSEYSSARINSAGKAKWTYGRMEARMKLPGGKGTWPAFWMMPEDITKYGWNYEVNYWWPNSGEIDIMEYVGYDKGWVHGSVHSEKYYFKKGNQRTGKTYIGDCETAFHVYAVEWFADRMDFFVDNIKYFTVYNDNTGWQSWPFNHDFHIIFNLAVGGDWGGAQGVDSNIWPRRLEVDYVRVYKQAACPTTTLPAKIEAENYCQMSGVQKENCSEGGQNVGWIDNGDWMSYQIKVNTAGSYKVSYRVASPNSSAVLRLDKDAGATTLATINVPNTGGWQSWQTISNVVTLPAGTYTIGLNALTGGCNINWIDIQPNTQSYYVKIEAENYASMLGVQKENCSEGGQNVGWIDANDWMSYNVNLPYTGIYTVKYRVASPNSNGVIVLSKNATDIHSRTIASTGGWQNWTTLSQNVSLVAGQQSLALFARTGGYNINWWSIEWGANGTKAAEIEEGEEIATSVNKASSDAVLIYPNPTTDKLSIELANDYQNTSVALFDLSGRMVENLKMPTGQKSAVMELGSLIPGVYMLKVSDGSNSQMIKVIKK
jgi:beta-glucanase (GH16 family)